MKTVAYLIFGAYLMVTMIWAKKKKSLTAVIATIGGFVAIAVFCVIANRQKAKSTVTPVRVEWKLISNASDDNEFDEVKKHFEDTLKVNRTVEVLLEYAAFLHKHSHFSEALPLYEEALQICKDLVGKNPQVYLPAIAGILYNLASLHSDSGEYAKALEECEEAVQISRDLAKENPQNYLPFMAGALLNLAWLHSSVNDYPKASEEYEEALKIWRAIAEENPESLFWVAMNLESFGFLHKTINEYAKASEEYEEALEIRRGLAEENPKDYLPDVAETLNNLSMLYQDGRPNKELSLQYAREAIDILGKCNDTPSTQEELEKANRIIEKWDNGAKDGEDAAPSPPSAGPLAPWGPSTPYPSAQG